MMQRSAVIVHLSKWFLLVVVLIGCGRSPVSETFRNLTVAEEKFTSAANEEHYRVAAQTHQQVIESGFESGRALYNQGNAYLKSNQPAHAIAAYRQALRFIPRDGQLISNLETALGAPLEQSTRRTVWDYVFIWQRWLSYREKFQLATFFLIATLGLLWYSRWIMQSVPLRRLAMFAGLLCVLFIGSSILDWHRIERQRFGVLTREATPRKGNSDNYEAAFTRPLPEGTEFTVEEQRGEWLRGRFADDAVGWLPEDSSVVY